MKTILRVCKTELRTLFYSPIAWFLMIVFLIQCSVIYTDMLDGNAKTQELGGYGLLYMRDLTERIFLSPRGLFGSVMQNLYLYIPLLTMSLISRETSSGTIKLLYSSPIKVREIIFGKFLSMMVYSLILVAIVGIFIVSGIFQVQHAETGMLMTAALGFYLLLCAYSAIGLFMSCLTTYQVVAAICTFVMIGILSYVGTLWQGIAFVRDLTYFLSINGRTQKMLSGLVTSKDVIYFILIVYIFLGLSIYKLRAGMESKPAMVKAGRYAFIVVSALLIGYVSSIPKMIGYYDATFNKKRTLTPNAQKILAELGDEPLTITAYNNLLGNYYFFGRPDAYNQTLARWEPYMRFKNSINLDVVSYYDTAYDNPWSLKQYPGKTLKEIATQTAKSNDIKLSAFKTPEEIRKIIDLKPELNRYVMQLKWKNRTTFLRIFDDQMVWPSETEVSAAFKRLLQAKLPKIAFLTGDLERDIDKMGDREYKAITNLSTFRYSLINQGFDVDSVSLETQEIPADIATLVIADPKVEFTPTTMAKLQKYIDNGGNLLIAGEPGKQDMLNPLLQKLGVQINEGMLIQESKEFAPNLVTPDLSKFAGTFTKSLQKSVEDSTKISMPSAAGLTYTAGGPFNIQPLLTTDAKTSWNRIKKLDLETMTTAVGSDDAGATNVTVSGGATPVTATVVTAPTSSPKTAPGNNGMEQRKKTMDSVRTVIAAIMNGEGTQEEKQKKASAVMATIKPMPMTPQQKKTSDSVRTVVSAIMNGAGTPAEKQQKVMAIMNEMAKKSATPATAPKAQAAPANAAVVSTGSAGVMVMSPDGGRGKRAGVGTVAFSAADGDVRGPITTAVSLTRNVNGKEQRIVVTGDADFMSNNELQRYNITTANFVFSTAVFSWLSYGDFPIDTSRPNSKDTRVNVTTDQVDFLKIIYIWILPGILLAMATILLIRRKRK